MKTFVMNKSLFQCRKKFENDMMLKIKQLRKENEQLRKEENEKLRKENKQLRKENEKLSKNNAIKDATKKESIKKPIEIKVLKKIKIRQIIILTHLTEISSKKC